MREWETKGGRKERRGENVRVCECKRGEGRVGDGAKGVCLHPVVGPSGALPAGSRDTVLTKGVVETPPVPLMSRRSTQHFQGVPNCQQHLCSANAFKECHS